jgi:hypothetical protein
MHMVTVGGSDAGITRGVAVTQMEQLPEVLPTVDPELGALVQAELAGHGVEVLAGTTVTAIGQAPPGALPRNDRRRGQRPGPVLHPAVRLPMGRDPGRRPGLDPPGQQHLEPPAFPRGRRPMPHLLLRPGRAARGATLDAPFFSLVFPAIST